MITLLTLFILFLFFIWHFIRMLRLRGEQATTEPLWIPKEIGWGVSINSRNPLGFWVIFIVDIAVLMTILCLIFVLVFVEGM